MDNLLTALTCLELRVWLWMAFALTGAATLVFNLATSWPANFAALVAIAIGLWRALACVKHLENA